MLFYMKNVKLLRWDKSIKKDFKKYFMIKIIHKVSVMQLVLYDHNKDSQGFVILNKETRVSDIITSL